MSYQHYVLRSVNNSRWGGQPVSERVTSPSALAELEVRSVGSLAVIRMPHMDSEP